SSFQNHAQAAHVNERELVEVEQDRLAALAKPAQHLAQGGSAGQIELAPQAHADPASIRRLDDFQPKMFVAQRACSFVRGASGRTRRRPATYVAATSRGGERRRSSLNVLLYLTKSNPLEQTPPCWN